MSANPRIGIGGRSPPSMELNAVFLLWAMTTAATLLAGLSLVANLWVYIFNGIGVVYGWPAVYPEMNHARWLFSSGLLGAVACAVMFLKSRVEARARSITTVRLPDRLTARTTGIDPVLDKFQCRARVEIDVYTDELARTIKEDPGTVVEILENGLEIAITDQITRYSKAKIEETLKLSLGERFDLLDIVGVTLLDLRQERVVDPPTEPPIDRDVDGKDSEESTQETDMSEDTPSTIKPEIVPITTTNLETNVEPAKPEPTPVSLAS
jgi:hypothetical protein